MKVTNFGKKQLRRVLTVVFAFLLTLSCIAMAITTEYVTTINGWLGITNTIAQEIGEGEETDSIRYKSDYSSLDELYAHQQALAEELEAEGAVLLENNGALPLEKGAKVSLFSRSSVDVGYGGTGSGSVNSAVAITMKDAFEKDGKMSVNPTLWTAYKNYKTPVDNRVQSGFTGPATFYLLEADADLYAAVREACHRNLYVIANSAEMNGLTSNMRIVTVLTPYQKALIAAIVVFGVLFAGSAALLTVQTYFRKEEN